MPITKRVVHTNLFIGGVGDGKRIELSDSALQFGHAELPHVSPLSVLDKIDSVGYDKEQYTLRTLMSDDAILTFWVKQDWTTERALRKLFQSYEEFDAKKRG